MLVFQIQSEKFYFFFFQLENLLMEKKLLFSWILAIY